MIEIVDAKYVGDYKIELKFNDGVSGEIDLENELWGPVFEPLKDKEFFSDFSLSPLSGTIVWENEADFAPEFLYDLVKIKV
jgi:hypothetical protein